MNAEPFLLLSISIFGSLLFLAVLGIFRWLLGLIGLKAIPRWSLLDYFMICFGVTGFFGGFLIILLVVVMAEGEDTMTGVRLLLIWLALFLCVITLNLTHKEPLKKWVREMEANGTIVVSGIGSGNEKKGNKGKSRTKSKTKK